MKNLYFFLIAIFFSFSSYAQVGPINGTLSVCVGLNTALSDTSAGGTWSCDATGIASVSATGVVSGLVAGTSNVTYTTGSGSSTAVVTVNPSPGPILGALSVCNGLTTTLNDLSSGGTWSSSAPAIVTIGAASGVATPVSVGYATIIYILPTGCSVTAVVTANPIPTPIIGPSAICIGYTTGLTDGVSGGVWSAAPSIVGSVSTSGMVTGISAGTMAVSYTLSTGCFATRIMTVTASPAAITGGLALCLGGSDTLHNATPGGTWSSSNTSVAQVWIDGTTYTYGPGTATISYTTAAGCYATAVLTVTVTVPPITGVLTTCVGNTSTLSETATGGFWSSSNVTVASVSATGIVTGTSAGTTQVSYTLLTGCSTSSVYTVTLCPCSGMPGSGYASASYTSLCYGRVTTLMLNGVPLLAGITYQWQTSPDSTTWTDLAGATSYVRYDTPAVSHYYRCMQTCTVSGLSAYSSAVHVSVTSAIASHSIISTDTFCNLAHFSLSTCSVSSSFHLLTYFGDGTSLDTTLVTSGGAMHADVRHTYSAGGSFWVKQVLMSGLSRVDSAAFSYTHSPCSTLPVSFYYDANGNCVFDAGDALSSTPGSVAVDSAGIVIDTFSVTSGLYYRAYGPAGTVYGFTYLGSASGLTATCPTAVLHDTLGYYPASYAGKSVALSCGAGSPDFDLSVSTSASTGRHTQFTNITVTNTHCYAVNPVVTMIYDTKYGFTPTIWTSCYTNPMPTSVSGNVLTWNLNSLAAGASQLITVYIERPYPTPFLPVGDTIHTTISVGPTTGDSNPANNMVVRCDSVKSSFDPNYVEVEPQGYILPCTQLQYKINFENTGNDTAHNIYVLDTLSDLLDISSLQIVTASAPMNIAILHSGGHNVAKFDFPHINLLDTSHHKMADGMVIFNIKAKSTIADGNIIPNQAGIYFDDNEAVMTNNVQNTIGMATITGAGNLCGGSFDTLMNAMAGGTWSASNANASVADGVVTGLLGGLDTIRYTVSNSCVTRTVTKTVTVDVIPVTSPIAGATAFCAGSFTTLSDAVAGGVWSSGATGVATVAGGVVTAISIGTADITYIVTNACGADTAATVVTVNPLPDAGMISGVSSLCAGTAISLSATATGGAWSSGASGTATVGSSGEVAGVSAGVVTISYAVINSCGTAYATMVETVNATVVPLVDISATPGDTVCTGSAAMFIAAPTNGGVAPFYQWQVNGVDVITGITYSYIPANGDVVTVLMASHALCASPDTVMHSVTIVTQAATIPVVSLSASSGFSIGVGQVDTLTATVSGGGSSPSYQWIVNGVDIPGATNATYYSTFNNHDSVSCRVTSSGVCAGYTSYNSVYITVVPEGVATVGGGAGLALYPNPAADELNIVWNNNTGGNAGVVIADVAGREVFRSTINMSPGTSIAHVDLPFLINGMYMVTVRSDNGIAHGKLEIKR